MAPHTAHADLISSTHRNWDKFFDSSETVSDDFMVEREQPSIIKKYLVPLSRFRREFNSWSNKTQSGNIIIVTQNKCPAFVFMSYQLYKKLGLLKIQLEKDDIDAAE